MIPLSAKEKEKLGHLYVKYSRLIWYVSVRIVRDEGLAEDMTHDTFLKVANQIDSVKAVEGIKTKCFLITIAKHLCVDYFRKMKAKKMDYSYNLDSLLDQAPLPLDQVCQNERDTALHNALQSLDEDYQEGLYLRFVSELNRSSKKGCFPFRPTACKGKPPGFNTTLPVHSRSGCTHRPLLSAYRACRIPPRARPS